MSEITTQPKSNNLDYMIDPTFKSIKRLFPSRLAIFREYSLNVPSVLQCSGHPGDILRENIF